MFEGGLMSRLASFMDGCVGIFMLSVSVLNASPCSEECEGVEIGSNML
jgi:hypothetical protein